MAVAPAWQRRRVGARLIEEGLDRRRAAGHQVVVVLCHPSYDPRFGFALASRLGLRQEHPAADEAFMALKLVPASPASAESSASTPSSRRSRSPSGPDSRLVGAGSVARQNEQRRPRNGITARRPSA